MHINLVQLLTQSTAYNNIVLGPLCFLQFSPVSVILQMSQLPYRTIFYLYTK